jgi:arylsulfatase A-like enzyme
MKKVIRFLSFILSCFLLYACTSPGNPDQPNIILIMSDDVGYSDIGCYGGEIRTPNLDGLAANGLRYTQFYNTSRCCPTRAALLTGLHQHQAGVGHMVSDRGNDGYRGDLNEHCLTIAQVMKTAGYKNYMSGKWHVTPLQPSRENPDRHNWPLQRGFDRFFGTIHGAGSFYDPNSLTSGNTFIAPGANFYYTDAISDTAVKFIREHNSDDPFFMYVAYTAAHWPMHALPKDIAKYKGMYDIGWDSIRSARYARMIEMGLIKPGWEMSPGYPADCEWEKTEMKEWHAQCMEVYAAMLDNMDQGIGRIIRELESQGKLENTVIFYLQDNGACAETYGFGREYIPPEGEVELHPMAPGELQTEMVPKYTRDGWPVRVGHGVIPGPADTFLGYAMEWANASNTPFRMFKHWSHEGGISTPLIVHWPAGIKARGEFRDQPSQLVDIMATCVALGGKIYPEEYEGNKIHPMAGGSLVPSFRDQPLDKEFLYWEHEGNRAIRKGKWKLVSRACRWPHDHEEHDVLPVRFWELYDLEADRTENHDLASQYPDMVKELSAKWQAWAEGASVVPKPPMKPTKPEWAKEFQDCD